MSHCGYIEACILFAINFDLVQFRKPYPHMKLYDLQEWYPVLEYWAQDKANLCLPPTQYEFYDFVVIQKYGVPEYDTNDKDACQAVIVSESIKAENMTLIEMKRKIIDYVCYDRLHRFERLAGNQWGLNRKQVSQVGCGYTVRLNKTHYIDHLVRLYCAFEFKQKGLHYAVTRGPPCTKCNYYQTEYPWRCGKRYKHFRVASIANETRKIQTIEHQNCLEPDNSSISSGENSETTNSEKIQRKTWHYSSTEKKPPADELSQFYSANKGTVEEWSLLEEIHKANQFSYHHEADFECNLCKYLVIFAACSTAVVIIMAAYVFYVMTRYQQENYVTA